MSFTEQTSSIMMTPKEALWNRYYDAVRKGRKEEARLLLKQIHSQPTLRHQTRKCTRCRKRF